MPSNCHKLTRLSSMICVLNNGGNNQNCGLHHHIHNVMGAKLVGFFWPPTRKQETTKGTPRSFRNKQRGKTVKPIPTGYSLLILSVGKSTRSVSAPFAPVRASGRRSWWGRSRSGFHSHHWTVHFLANNLFFVHQNLLVPALHAAKAPISPAFFKPRFPL